MCGFHQYKHISAEQSAEQLPTYARHEEAIVCDGGAYVSFNAEGKIKYIILSFTSFSRCSRDGGEKRDEERRVY